ncbi:MAG: endonuclease MutS2 [Erysipelothrix sp.]|nr:endonuclease MutS2 [Erysipelothrix sp.]
MNDALEFKTILEIVSTYAHFDDNQEVLKGLTPSFKRLEITQRLNDTYDAMEYILSGGDHYLKGLSNTQATLIKASKGGLCDILDLVALNKVNHRLITLKKQVFKTLRGERVLDVLDGMVIYMPLVTRLDACFSPTGEVLDSASPTLKSLRKQLRDVEGSINKQTQDFMRQNANRLSEQVVTMRGDRYVLMAKISEKNTFNGLIVGESASGQSAYVEPAFLMQLNNQKQTIESNIENEIERIAWECSNFVGEHALTLKASHEALMMLDEWFAKARYGLERDANIPKLGGKSLHLEAARHPLIDPKAVVANTYHLDDTTRICIISGPNTGGKTVALKIIGLFTLMAYAGLPILVRAAQLPFYDGVFADIGDEQSIQSSLSTFSSHISNISQILTKVTPASLVLLDELGSGTDPDEGESLAIAILDAFYKKECTLIATTHYNRIKQIAYEWDGVMISSVEFDIQTLSPTYRFFPHQAGQSNALAIASRFALPESLLQRASEELETKRSETTLLLERLNEQIQTNQLLEESLLTQVKDLEDQKTQLSSQEQALKTKLETIERQAQTLIQEKVNEAVEEIQMYLQEASQQKHVTQTLQNIKKEVVALSPIPTQKIDETIGVKDYVKVKGSQRSGQVLEIKGKQAMIDINGMRIKASLSQLEKTQAPKPKKNVATYTAPSNAPRGSLLECVVVGMRGDEAIAKVNDYIEDCLMNNIPSGIIIHGVGTLILKKVIGEHLSRHPNVKSYAQAPLEQGGIVATVVTFK